MITEIQIQRFISLRSKLFAAINKELENDGSAKGSDGTFHIIFPGYFNEINNQSYIDEYNWGISLYCYIIGPRRRYEWWGKDFETVLTKAENDISGMIKNNF